MKKVLSALIAVGILPLSGQVMSATYDPAYFNVTDGIRFTPEIGIGLGYDDNTAHTEDNKIDSWFYRLAPEFTAALGNNTTRANATYRLVDAQYFDSDEDDYTDHSFRVGLEHHFTRRHRIESYYHYRRDHEARGEGFLEFFGDTVDSVAELDIHDAAIIYGFGRPSARINLEFEAGYYDKSYSNYRSTSQYLDYDSVIGRGTLYWRLGAKTQLLGEWNGFDTSYDRDPPNSGEVSRDSFDQLIFAGIRWDATKKTAGTIKLGYENRDFDDSGREDFDGFAWVASLDWKPRSYSTFSFESGSRSKNPDTLGDYVEEDSYKVAWNHQWRESISTMASVKYIDEAYTGFDRDDEFLETSIGISVAWLRWLTSDLSYQYSDKDSNLETVKYDKNQFLATVRVSL